MVRAADHVEVVLDDDDTPSHVEHLTEAAEQDLDIRWM